MNRGESVLQRRLVRGIAVVALLGLASILLVACGGSDSGSSHDGAEGSTGGSGGSETGEGGGEDEPSEGLAGKKVAFLTGPRELPALNRGIEVVEELFGNAGADVEIYSAELTAAAGVRDLNQAISKGAELIVWQAATQEGSRQTLMKAEQEGIPVILSGTTPLKSVEDLFTTYVVPDFHKKAEESMELLMKGIKESGGTGSQIAILSGKPASNGSYEEEGTKAADESSSDFEVVSELSTLYDPIKAAEMLRPIFARYSDLAGIWAAGGPIAGAAVHTAEEAGRTAGTEKGDVFIVGADCDTSTIKAIQEGKIYATVSYGPVFEFEAVLGAAEQIAAGEEVPSRIIAPTSMITKANVGQYAEKCEY